MKLPGDEEQLLSKIGAGVMSCVKSECFSIDASDNTGLFGLPLVPLLKPKKSTFDSGDVSLLLNKPSKDKTEKKKSISFKCKLQVNNTSAKSWNRRANVT